MMHLTSLLPSLGHNAGVFALSDDIVDCIFVLPLLFQPHSATPSALLNQFCICLCLAFAVVPGSPPPASICHDWTSSRHWGMQQK